MPRSWFSSKRGQEDTRGALLQHQCEHCDGKYECCAKPVVIGDFSAANLGGESWSQKDWRREIHRTSAPAAIRTPGSKLRTKSSMPERGSRPLAHQFGLDEKRFTGLVVEFSRLCTLLGNANEDPSDALIADFDNNRNTSASWTRKMIAKKGVHAQNRTSRPTFCRPTFAGRRLEWALAPSSAR